MSTTIALRCARQKGRKADALDAPNVSLEELHRTHDGRELRSDFVTGPLGQMLHHVSDDSIAKNITQLGKQGCVTQENINVGTVIDIPAKEQLDLRRHLQQKLARLIEPLVEVLVDGTSGRKWRQPPGGRGLTQFVQTVRKLLYGTATVLLDQRL